MNLTLGRIATMLGVLFSMMALIFGLLSLSSYYVIDAGEPASDPFFAWAPYANVCSFLALGAVIAGRGSGGPSRRLAGAAGAVMLIIALIVGSLGVAQAAWNDASTMSHGVGWLSFAQPAAVVGAAWVLYAGGLNRSG